MSASIWDIKQPSNHGNTNHGNTNHGTEAPQKKSTHNTSSDLEWWDVENTHIGSNHPERLIENIESRIQKVVEKREGEPQEDVVNDDPRLDKFDEIINKGL